MAQLAVFDFEVKYRHGQLNKAADALSRHPLAGEPEPVTDDVEFDGCVVICNVIEKGTHVDTELAAAGIASCKVRQIRALERGSSLAHLLLQGNAPVIPSYSKAEWRTFQDQDPVIRVFGTFWEQKRKPNFQERKNLAKLVLALLKHWLHIKERDGLLYRVVDDVRHGECFQLLVCM